MKKNTLFFVIIVLAVVAGGAYFLQKPSSDSNTSHFDGVQVTVYKSPLCDCCASYIAELEKHGFQVETTNTENMGFVKQDHNIPKNMESCHTSVIGDYFIEGHVPLEAVNKLLKEKPDIDGIALPDMPAGSPGMPGRKAEVFTMYALKNGVPSEFMRT